MSDYTITLKRCSEVYGKNEILSWFMDYQELNYLSVNEYSKIVTPDLYGNPIFNKELLANMIFEHYYLREIAYETPEMFRHYAKVKLQEIMGKYLPLFYSLSLKYNPLENNETFKITETFEGNKRNEKNNSSSGKIKNEGSSTTTGNSSSSSNSNSSSLEINNDTPQGEINKENILNGSYASSTSANENESQISDNTSSASSNNLENEETRTNSEKSNGNELEQYSKSRNGYDLKMTNMEKVLEFRKTIQNYYLDIINECNSLFFALF